VVAFAASLFAFREGARSEGYNAWVNPPSPALSKQFKNWQLAFEEGESHDDPGRGIFSWRGRYRQGIGRLVAKPPRHVALAPVAASTQYVGMNVPRKSGQLVITRELTNVFHQADVLGLINKYGLAIGPLDYATDLEFARVQHFAAALRTPRKKEQIVSIRWRATHDAKENRFGMALWGVFAREGNGLKPIHLVANRAYTEDEDEFEVLAVGDLNGDGIDELIARVFVYEPEDDRLAILEWERGALVSLYDTH
jgi:hypothetical protein